MILPEPRDRFRGTLPKRWVALDFETTGIWKKDPDVAVIEIGLITYERDREVAAWSALVKSDTPVSDFIAELTGITQAMIDKDGVDVDEAGDGLAERLDHDVGPTIAVLLLTFGPATVARFVVAIVVNTVKR